MSVEFALSVAVNQRNVTVGNRCGTGGVISHEEQTQRREKTMLARLMAAALPQPKRTEEARVHPVDPLIEVLARVSARQESY